MATLLRFALRRERILLPVWMLGIVALLGAAGGAIASEFGDLEERTALAAIAAGNPAFLFLRGLPDGAGVGALVFFQTFAFLAVLTGLMTTFLVTRHTRTDEERGRAELVHATPLRRLAPLTTALTLAAAANVVLALLTTGVGMLVGFAPASAALTGAALGAVGLAFAGLAALAAQLMPSPRAANGLSAALVGLAYLTRGIGDALGTARDLTHVDPSWISLLSPIGWAQATRPFSEATPWPLIVPLGLGVLAAAAALAVRSRRDLGSSLLGDGIGRPRWLRASATRLAVRSQVGTTIGWAVGTATLGLLAGILTPVVVDAIGANDDLAALIRRLAPDLEVTTGDLFTVALLGIAATLATAAGIHALLRLRLRLDEAEGRAELLLATPLRRVGWYGRQLAVAAGAMVVVALAGGLAAGLGAVASGTAPDRIATALTIVLVHLPAGSVFVGLTALAFSVLPRLTVAAGWGLLVVGLVVGQLGDLIGLPGWLQDVSPFHHVPAVPLEPIDPAPLVVSLAVATAAAVLGAVALRRRDIPT